MKILKRILKAIIFLPLLFAIWVLMSVVYLLSDIWYYYFDDDYEYATPIFQQDCKEVLIEILK
jgi:hypothetical protein